MPLFSPSSTLNAVAGTRPPDLLFHYTSSDALVGILKSREMWASNVAFLNDSKEIGHAVDHARLSIENKFRRGTVDTSEMGVLEAMERYVGSAAKRYYVASFSEESDLLSQWRAYCPPGGGYSIGIPARRMAGFAAEQGFSLVKCVYDSTVQVAIASELVEAHLTRFRELRPTMDESTLLKQISWEFGQSVARYGPILKHPAFREEREWRLVSGLIQEPHDQLDYRGSPNRVVPYFKVRIPTSHEAVPNDQGAARLTVIVGRTSDMYASTMATQFMLSSLAPGAAHGSSQIPYRAW